MTILIDTREQIPLWHGSEDFPAVKQKLDVGDYTTTLLLGRVHAERKNPNDLYGSIIQGHERFRNELLRAQRTNVKLVVFVECTAEEFFAKTWDVRQKLKCPSKTLRKILATMTKKYKFEIVWCTGRPQMRKLMFEWFKKHEKTINGSETDDTKQTLDSEQQRTMPLEK